MTSTLKAAIAAALAASVMLAGCGDTSNMDKLIEEKTASEGETTTTGVTLSPIDEAVISQAEEAVTAPITTSQPPLISTVDQEILKNGDIDIDLVDLNSNMVYAQVFQMTGSPEEFVGKTVRAKGTFAHTTDESTGQDYFAVFIADAAACCQQGLEFRRDGEFSYPDDYPEEGDEIIVTGTFNSYKEGLFTYCELKDATMEVVEQTG